MVQTSDDKNLCRRCGKPLSISPDQGVSDDMYCNNCMIELGEKQIPEKTKPGSLIHKETSRLWTMGRWVILVICIAVIGIQVPKIMSAFQDKKPIRSGPLTTDKLTDQCIGNLWKISQFLQDGRYPGPNMICPATKKMYVIVSAKGNTVASCPNPDVHGFKELSVSKKVPRPEVKR